jgi:SAM-dependent methyltransferase
MNSDAAKTDLEDDNSSVSFHLTRRNSEYGSIEAEKTDGDDKRPKNNKCYGSIKYWEDRFEHEEQYDWLFKFSDVQSVINRFLKQSDCILIVGCGNSSFSADLFDAGYKNITSIDYSANVISRMTNKYKESRPTLLWHVMDMTEMSSIANDSFDVVIDKAAMDALMSLEGDVWNPKQEVVDACRKYCLHVSRVLKIDGYFLQFTFAQPHFRKKYLLGIHKCKDEEKFPGFNWDLYIEKIDGRDGCFQNYLYIMKKLK